MTALRQLGGGALSDLLGPLFQAFFGQSGEAGVALWRDVGVKDPR